MSEMSQGPGWWQASDDKWYPPESHPDVVAARASEAASKKAEEPSKSEQPAPSSPPVPSTPSPASAPGAVTKPTVKITSTTQGPPVTSNTPTTVSSSSTIQSTPTVPPPVGDHGIPPWTGSSVAPKRSKVPWMIGVVIIVGLAVAALIVALASGSSSSTFANGASAVAFQIAVPSGGRPFSGTVGGKNVSGRVVQGGLSGGSDFGTSSVPFFSYQGSLGSTSYVLHVAIDEQSSQTQSTQTGIAFDVTGTYGSEPVKGSASFNLGSLIGSSETVSFNGHVGSQPLRGEATATMQKGGGITITGTVNAVPAS